MAESEFFGCWVAGSGLANNTMNGDFATEHITTPFRPKKSGSITHVQRALRWDPNNANSGYGGGTGGTIAMEIRTDNLADPGFPTSTILGTATWSDPSYPSSSSEQWPKLAFDSPVSVTEGTLYHLVVHNIDPSPSVNYVSTNSVSTKTSNQPAVPDEVWPSPEFNVYQYKPTFPGNGYAQRGNWSDVLTFYFDDGVVWGDGYINTIRGSEKQISGNNQLRARFTAPVGGLVVDRFALWVGWADDSASGDITGTLRDSSNNVLAQASLNSSQVQSLEFVTQTDPRPWVWNEWSTFPTFTAVNLAGGQEYTLTYTAPSGTVFYSFPAQAGDILYGLDPQTVWDNQSSEYSSNGGSNWTLWRNDYDLPTYFHKVIDGPIPPASEANRYGPGFSGRGLRPTSAGLLDWAAGPWAVPITGNITAFSQYFLYANSNYYEGTGGVLNFVIRSDNNGVPGTDNRGEFTITDPIGSIFTPPDGENFQEFSFNSPVAVTAGEKIWVTCENQHGNPSQNWMSFNGITWGDGDAGDIAFHHTETSVGSGVFTKPVYDSAGNGDWGLENDGYIALCSFKYSTGYSFGRAYSTAWHDQALDSNKSARQFMTPSQAFNYESLHIYLYWLSGSQDVTATLKQNGSPIATAIQTSIDHDYDEKNAEQYGGFPTRGWWRWSFSGTLSASTPYELELTTSGNFLIGVLEKGWDAGAVFNDGYADYNDSGGYQGGWPISGGTSTDGVLMFHFGGSPVGAGDPGTIDWGTAVDTGTFPNSGNPQVRTFTPKVGNAIKLVATSEVNGNAWTTLAELGVLVDGGGTSSPATQFGLGNHHIDAYVNYQASPQDVATATFNVISQGGSPPAVDIQPGTNIQSVINANPGQDVRIKAGVHRNQKITSISDNVTIYIENGAYVRGSDDISSGWVQEGSNWYHSFNQSVNLAGEGRGDSPRATWHVDLFENGDIGGWHVANKGDLGNTGLIPGWNPRTWTYWVDTGSNRIYMDHNPNGALMEVTNTDRFFINSANNVTIEGEGYNSVIEHYASPVQRGAVQMQGNDCTIRKVRVQKNHGGNIHMGATTTGGNRALVERCWILYGGQNGITISVEPIGQDNPNTLSDAVLRYCEIANNNIAGISTGWEAGGSKFARTTGMQCYNNDVHDNYGKALWWDIDNFAINCEWNEVYDNSEIGIFNEIGFDADIHHNTVYGNAKDGSSFQGWSALRGGIIIAACPDNSVYENTVYDNGKSGESAMDIGATQQNRWYDPDPQKVRNSHNEGNLDLPNARLNVGLRVHHNDIGGNVLSAGVGINRDWTPDGGQVDQGGPDFGLACPNWGGDDLGIFESLGNNLFYENNYPGTQTPSYNWDNGSRSFAYWQADGNDTSTTGRTEFTDPRGGVGPSATGDPEPPDPPQVVTRTIATSGYATLVVEDVPPQDDDRYVTVQTVGGYVSTSDKPSFSNISQMDVRIDVALNAYSGLGNQAIVGQWGASNNKSWYLYFDNIGQLTLAYTPDGITTYTSVVGLIPGLAAAERVQIKTIFTPFFNGTQSKLATWYRFTHVDLNLETGWTAMSSIFNTASTINDVNATLRVGAQGGANAGIGKYYGMRWSGYTTPPPPVAGDSALYLDGAGESATTPDSAALDIAGDIDIRAHIKPDNWASGQWQVVVGKDESGARSWTLFIGPDGSLSFYTWHSGGLVVFSSANNFAQTRIPNGGWIRATMDANNGAGNKDGKLYTSTDGTNWLQLGPTNTHPGIGSIDNTTAVVRVGANQGTNNQYAGLVYRVQIYDGINGAIDFDADFSQETPGTTSFTEDSVNAATVTLQGTAEIIDTGSGPPDPPPPSGIINVQAYGVVGDGTADDTAALQSLASAAEAGSTLWFPKTANYYKLTSPVTITKPMIVKGAGWASGSNAKTPTSFLGATIRQTTSTESAFRVTSSNVKFEGLHIRGESQGSFTGDPTFPSAVNAVGSSPSHIINLTVVDCKVEYFRYGGIRTKWVDDVVVRNTLIQNVRYAGVAIFAGNRSLIETNQITTINSVTPYYSQSHNVLVSAVDETQFSTYSIVQNNTLDDNIVGTGIMDGGCDYLLAFNNDLNDVNIGIEKNGYDGATDRAGDNGVYINNIIDGTNLGPTEPYGGTGSPNASIVVSSPSGDNTISTHTIGNTFNNHSWSKVYNATSAKYVWNKFTGTNEESPNALRLDGAVDGFNEGQNTYLGGDGIDDQRSSGSNASAPATPSTPDSVDVNRLTSGAITITWNYPEPNDHDAFEIEYRQGGSWTPLAFAPANNATWAFVSSNPDWVTVNTASFTTGATDVPAGDTEVRIRALAGETAGSWSTLVTTGTPFSTAFNNLHFGS